MVTRIITACECGHIDDFPWVKWVHCKNMYGGAKPICAHPALTFKTSASSTEGLEGLTVSCDSCGARATLKGAFDKDALQELDQKYEAGITSVVREGIHGNIRRTSVLHIRSSAKRKFVRLFSYHGKLHLLFRHTQA